MAEEGEKHREGRLGERTKEAEERMPREGRAGKKRQRRG